MRRSLLAGLSLGILGLSANCFPVELFLNVDFSLGSFFTILALLRYGGGAALLAGIIATSAAWYQWQAPWAMAFTFAEILFVTWRLRRNSRNIIISDTIYWFGLCAPLSWLLYHNVLDFQTVPVQLLILKQGVNGVLNAVMANIIWITIRIVRKESGERLPSFQEIIFTATLGLIMPPPLIGLVVNQRQTLISEAAGLSTPPLHELLSRMAIKGFTAMILLVTLAGIIAHHFSRIFATALLHLRERSSETPLRIREPEYCSPYPASGISEVEGLINNFRRMEQALRVSFREIEEKNELLKAQLREITEMSSQIDLKKELETEKRFLRSLLDTIPDIVFIKDLEGRYLGCNTAFATRYAGLPQDQIIGRTDPEINSDLELAHYRRLQDSAVITSGEAIVIDEQFPLIEGRHVWFETVKSPFRDCEEKIIGIIGISREVTERLELIRELESSRRDMQIILDNLPMLAWHKDTKGRYKMVNQNFMVAVGKSMSEIIGFTDREVWPRELAEKFMNDDREVMTSRMQKRLEEQVADRCGNTWHETFKAPIIDERGQVQGTTGAALSITDRKKAEETSMKVLSLQSATLEATADGILVVDRTGRWSSYNKKFLELWKIPQVTEEENGKRFLMTHALPQLDHPATFLDKVMELHHHPETTSLDILTFKDGRVFECYSQPQRLESTIVGRVWSFRDTTRHVRTERELITSREAAESANRFKSIFLANMSHEIRTPLNAFIGLGYLLQQTELSPLQRDYLGKMDQSAHSLLGLINDILDISRIEAGELRLEEADFSLVESLKRVVIIVESQAEAKGLDLHLSVKDDVPEFLRGDSFRLEQVLINLLCNAVKFTDHGSVILTAESVTAGGDAPLILSFSVKDSGIGLTPDQIAGLFQPFSQGDPSTTRRFGGSGLGLSICKRLIDLMQGDISVTSVLHEGSTFTFTVQFLQVSSLRPELSPCQPLQLDHIRNARVLVVEDNEINLLIMKELLSGAGVRVETAANGREAVTAIRSAQERFNIVFMDIQMPEMDGHEATRLIRKEWPASELPIIAMTAHAFKEEVQRCLDSGMNDHLAKPIEVGALHDRLCRWIRPPAKREPGAEQYPEEPVVPLPPPVIHPPVPMDPEGAMVRLAISPEKYRGIIALVRRAHADDAVLLRKELAAGNNEAAHLLSHTLKGVAANISAHPLAEAASALESAIKSDGLNRAEELLASVESTLAALVANIDDLTATGDEPKDMPMDLTYPAILNPQLERLSLLLTEQDLEAQTAFTHLSPYLKGKNPALTADLAKMMDDLNFSAVLELLDDFVETEQ